jgi:predicted amidohydrolase YtcJ
LFHFAVAFLISQQVLLFQIPKADIIFINEKVWTVDKIKPIAVGTNAEVKKYADKNTKIVDLGGRLILPDFIDGHTHFVSDGFQLFREGNSREKIGLIGLWTYGARKTPNPPGGLIVRNETNEPSVILKDESLSMFYKDAHLRQIPHFFLNRGAPNQK